MVKKPIRVITTPRNGRRGWMAKLIESKIQQIEAAADAAKEVEYIPAQASDGEETCEQPPSRRRRGYIQDHYTTTRRAFEFAEKIVEGLTPQEKRFFKHLLVCSFLEYKQGGSAYPWIPIYSKTIEKDLPGEPGKQIREQLRDAGLIEFTKADRLKHLSIEYQVTPEILEGWYELHVEESAEDYRSSEKLDFYSGKAVRTKAVHHSVSRNRSQSSIPSSIKESLRVYGSSLFNLAATKAHIAELENKAKVALEQMSVAPTDQARIAYHKARGKFLNDNAQFKSMYALAELVDGEIWTYALQYEVLRTGRLSGVFQSCSCEMKVAALTGIEYVNLDMASSQLYGLLILLAEAHQLGVFVSGGVSWLRAYLADEAQKKVRAKHVGISQDCWKQCLIAVAVHGHIPSSVYTSIDRRIPKILEYITKDIGGDAKQVSAALRRFKKEVLALQEAVAEWANWLMDKGPWETSKRGRYIRNASGMFLYQDELPLEENMAKAKSETIAHLLQGIEANFISHCAVLFHVRGIRYLMNEHDGLIILDTVPPDMITEVQEGAQKLTGFQYGVLREKPLLS